MLRIGDFSRLSGVSIKALRHYDDIGLLRPAAIDEDTSYRHYTGSQLVLARRIAALRDLGFSLSEIGETLRGADLQSMLDTKRREIQDDIRTSRQRLRRIDALLEVDAVDVAILRTPPRPALSIRTVVRSYGEADEWFAETKSRLPVDLREAAHGALWHTCEPEAHRIECEVVYFVDAAPPRGFRRVLLPETESATIVYAGDWRPAYVALDRALAANRLTMAGSKLERFIVDDVVELSVPVS